MTEYPLTELSGAADPAATVRQCEVVEHEQLARPEGDFDLDSRDVEVVTLEEFELRAQAVELRAAQKRRICLDAGKQRRGARRRLDEAGKASLDVARCIVPGAVRPAVANESTYELRPGRPCSLRQQRRERHEPGDRRYLLGPGRDVQGGIAGDVPVDLRVKR